jgi:hypothetical protein
MTSKRRMMERNFFMGFYQFNLTKDTFRCRGRDFKSGSNPVHFIS